MATVKKDISADISAVQDVITKYSYAVTSRNWDDLSDVFAPDATWRVVGDNANFFFSGSEVVPGIRGIVEATGFIAQINGPALIKIDGDVATAKTVLYEVGASADKTMRFEEPGIYDDVLHKVDGRWLFKSRHFTILHFQMDKIEQ